MKKLFLMLWALASATLAGFAGNLDNLGTVKETVYGGFTQEDASVILQLTEARNAAGLLALYQEGKAIPLDAGTQAFLLDISGAFDQIRPRGSDQVVWIPGAFFSLPKTVSVN